MVFSLAVAALIEGRVDAAWARWVRPWALAAWSLLTVGITLGSFWAYYELGWGGWWFWDPVENASFMPWLMATALLHSAIVTEKRGALAGWTRVPGAGRLHLLDAGRLPGALGRADLGPRLRRRSRSAACCCWSSWASPPASASRSSPGARRSCARAASSPRSAARARWCSTTSSWPRATATVLLGTLYPLIREALTGEAISVGPPYFNLTFAPLMAALALLPAGRAAAGLEARRPAPASASGCGSRRWSRSARASLTYALVSPRKALGAPGRRHRRLAGRRRAGRAGRAHAGLPRPGRATAGAGSTGLPRGAWGMTLAHLGLGVFVLGACFETALAGRGGRGPAARRIDATWPAIT